MDVYNSDDSDNSNGSDSSDDHIPDLGQIAVKTLKRCPFCNSSNIYKRIRAAWKEPKVKPYRCHECKQEFNVPIIGEKISRDMEKIW